MATFSTLHLFLLSLTLLSLLSVPSLASMHPTPHTFILPIEKDPRTLQYSTSISLGTPPVTMELVIDIRERFLWFECGDNYNSSTYRPVPCGTSTCKMARGTDCVDCTNHPLKTGCTNHTCGVDPFNPFAELFVSGDVGEDTLSSVYSTDGTKTLANTRVPRFITSCVFPDKFGAEGYLEGFAKGKKGVLGLARTEISLPTQLANKYEIDRKFALCLPSTTSKEKKGLGDVFVGGGPYYTPRVKASELLVYTPLILNRHSTGPLFDNRPSSEYFIGVKSIKVDGKFVNFNASLLSIDKEGNGGTKLSTVIPYTKLHTHIYRPLVKDFVMKSKVKRMKRVTAVAPFSACFDSRSIGKSSIGPDVPAIDLVLKGGVQWRIHGANSMVKAAESVLCLAFVDGGLEPAGTPLTSSIIIGGHQLEDNLVEFDLVSSKLGFTSSLLLHNSTCSHSRVF